MLPGTNQIQLVSFTEDLDSGTKPKDANTEYHSSINITPYNLYASSYYSSLYIKNWAVGVVPKPMLTPAGFCSFPLIHWKGYNLTYVYNSYDVFYFNGSSVISHKLSYVCPFWRSWCREQYSAYHNHWLIAGKTILAIEAQRLANLPTHQSKRKAFVICWHQDHWNYWHFTMDACYRLYSLVQHNDTVLLTTIDYLVIGPRLKQFQIDLIQSILGFLPDIQYYPFGAHLNGVIHIPITNRGFIDPIASRQFFGKVYLSHESAEAIASTIDNDRLYILRGNAKNGRTINNENEVIDLLRKYKFQILDPGAMSLASQITHFSRAAIVIGAHGSAFVNLAYMKKGFVIELVDESYDPIHDYLLASNHGIRFLRVKERSLSYTPNAFAHKDFICDVSKVKRALDVALNC